jgi:hypothetical protein
MNPTALARRGTLLFCLIFTGSLLMTLPACAKSTLSLTEKDRTSNRPADLWQYYMHGCVDHFATPVDLSSLADSSLLSNIAINTPYKQFTGKGITVNGKGEDNVTLDKPINIDLRPDQKLRLYVWVKGENAGMREDIWKAPNFGIVLKNAKGKTLRASETRYHTVGNFDWHCYYLDTHIHKNTASIYLKFTNPVRGKATFSAISYEWVNEQNDFSVNDQQDPITGSCAQNVYKDELPSHVQSDRGTRYPWHFLKGVKAIPAMTGQQYDITTQDGLKHYFQDHPHTLQPYHRHHSIMYLPSIYRTGKELKAESVDQTLWPNPYEGWMNDFAQLLLVEQDPKTGYWRTIHGLNMGLTFHYSNMLFRYYSPERADRPLRTNDLHIGLKYIPHANNIIDTTLMMQAHDDAGNLAAWNRSAYRYTTEPDSDDHNCDFGTTWDAIYLLRIAALNPEVDDVRKAKVYDAIKAAYGYLLKHNIQDDGTWKLKDKDPYPTRSSYMYGLIEDSHWLEWRIDPNIPAPDVKLDGNTIKATFTNPQHNSIRIFAVPADFDISQLDETQMVGIIQNTGHHASNMDPYLGMKAIQAGGKAMWGLDNDMPPADHWKYQRYTYWKTRKISENLLTTTDAKPITLPRELLKPGMKLYVTAANWYGEQSKPVLIPNP